MAGAQPEGTLNPTAIYITLAIPALNPTTIYYTLEVRHRQSAVNSSRIEGEAWGVNSIGLRPRPPTPKAEHHQGYLAKS